MENENLENKNQIALSRQNEVSTTNLNQPRNAVSQSNSVSVEQQKPAEDPAITQKKKSNLRLFILMCILSAGALALVITDLVLVFVNAAKG